MTMQEAKMSSLKDKLVIQEKDSEAARKAVMEQLERDKEEGDEDEDEDEYGEEEQVKKVGDKQPKKPKKK